MSASAASGTADRSVGTYDFRTYTDYYFLVGFQVNVICAIWTNLELRFNNLRDGVFGYHTSNPQLIGTGSRTAGVLNGALAA